MGNLEESKQLFWEIYDEYLKTKDVELHAELSSYLEKIEVPDRIDQLFRPEKGWDKIIGWQVLRNQEFVWSQKLRGFVFEGEIIVHNSSFNLDYFLTRMPIKQVSSGHYLKPGHYLSFRDQGNLTDVEWSQAILFQGITDERGLYLPIYQLETLVELIDFEFTKGRLAIFEKLKQLGYNRRELSQFM
jgi:hypothetical protein